MEESKKIGILPSSIFYLIRHFTQIDRTCYDELIHQGFSKKAIEEKLKTAGSKFDSEFASNPREIIDILNHRSPGQVIPQANKRTAYIYRFDESIGWDSIMDVNEIPHEDLAKIQEEKRGDQTIRTIERTESPKTNQIVAIVDSETSKVITLFPGCYAPALPSWDQSKIDFEQSRLFWESHVFIKRISHE
jgi:hypothetical protein